MQQKLLNTERSKNICQLLKEKISSQLEKEPKINLYWEENKKEWDGKDIKTAIEFRFKDLGEMW